MADAYYTALVDRLVEMPHDARLRLLAACDYDFAKLIAVLDTRIKESAVRAMLSDFANTFDTGKPESDSVVDVLGDIVRPSTEDAGGQKPDVRY